MTPRQRLTGQVVIAAVLVVAALVPVFGGGRVFGQQFSPLRLEGIRDVLQENQAEGDVLVIGGLQVLSQLVCG